MVNKVLISLAAVVLLSAVSVGVMIGTQLDGGLASTPTETPTGPQDSIETATATPAPATATKTATPVRTERRTSIPPSRFDETAISQYVATYLSDARAEKGLDRFETGGRTAKRVEAMAQSHSEAMAEARNAAHTIDGVTSAERYENHDLTQYCEFKSAEHSYVETPRRNRFEAVGATVAGQTYEANGETRFNANDSAVARAIVDGWLNSGTYRERLFLDNAERLGVGVVVTDDGDVYATANICG
ncbi:CAP domain-containing protein [Haloarcula nitratireducens]|uniref:CAP domain-containing protein n=1 Tax=Haloarcula nitratireducens TaxID=2487749 RepID=A0AAW4P7T1_9EURY|nr:CAP domain-containing protein [Halomicroarcula nitratireducens]MBX0293808.1 CAP domain-containing protein [Halomicroarcula nitratireducens]